MDVTDVQVRLVENAASKLRAYCRVTFDDSIVVHDVKVIDTANGVFVAMPSRRTMARCPACSGKNYAGAAFCNDCGAPQPDDAERESSRSHNDVVHPINQRSRRVIERAVLAAFERTIAARPNVRGPARRFEGREAGEGE